MQIANKREEVSEFYAKAVARTGGCCAGAVASGYAADELARLPDDAVASAFGCGNPLAFGEVAAGLGDIVYISLFGPRKPPKIGGGTFIWAVGPTTMFPTASKDILGLGKYSMGPAAVLAFLPPKWRIGTLAQHWFSFAGATNAQMCPYRTSSISCFMRRVQLLPSV